MMRVVEEGKTGNTLHSAGMRRLLARVGETLEAVGRRLRDRADVGQRENDIDQEESKSRLREENQAREALRVKGTLHWQNVPRLGQLWLQELKDQGLNELDQALKPIEKRTSGVSGFLSQYRRDVLYPVRFGKNSEQMLWLQPYDIMIKENGYMHTRVLQEPELKDVAILAAATVMEMTKQEVDTTKLDKAFKLTEFPLKQNMYDYMVTLKWLEHHPLESDEAFKEFEASIRGCPEGKIDYYFAGQIRIVGWVVALLRYYRPEFDTLNREEQVALIKQNLSAAGKLAEAARSFVGSIQEGKPWTGRPKRSVEKSSRYVTAALLAAVEGLGANEIGRRMGIEQSKTDAIKGQNRKASDAVQMGKSLLQGALGKDGYEKLIDDYKSQRDWFQSLSAEEQELEWQADALRYLVQSGGYSTQDIRRIFS